MKSGFYYSILLYTIITTLIYCSACSEISVNPDNLNVNNNFSEEYSDSLIFLSNRFSSDNSIYNICIMNIDGTGLRVVFNKWPVNHITWAPVKGKIFFSTDTSLTDDSYEIYEYLLDGTNERFLYSSADRIGELKISPDCKSIAFLTGSGTVNKLNLLDLENLENKELTEFRNDLRSIAWSPDGTSLGCVCKTGNDVHLKMFRLDNLYFAGERIFLDMVRDYNVIDWCRSSDVIAVNVNHYGFALSYAYDYQTKTDTNITAGNYIVEGLSWSPDGGRIVLAQTYNHLTVSSLYIYNKKGINAFKLTDDQYDDKFPCWQ
ncbi:hypothetical protein ACFLTH_00695 [Bacteroidota bacterium]